MGKLYPPSDPPELAELYDRLDGIYMSLQKKLENGDLTASMMGVDPSLEDPEQPAIQSKNLQFPDVLARELLTQIGSELKQLTEKRGEIDRLVSRVQSGEIRAGQLISCRLKGCENSGVEVSDALLDMVVTYTARPFLMWMAGEIENPDDRCQTWLKGTCPTCGATPELGRINEDGRRFLWCWLCATEWRYPRLRCPYCEEETVDGQRYFTVEETPYRVDLCDSCDHYLKVIDEREIGGGQKVELTWKVHDLVGRYLDPLALQEGYTAGG